MKGILMLEKVMLETDIKKLCNYVKNNLKGMQFDKGLALLRVKLWEIADKYNISSTDVFSLMMDNWNKYKN